MAHLHDAIRAINSSIVTIADTTATDANGVIVEYSMTQAQAKLEELLAAEAQAEQAAKDVKASALAKLAALGLTQDEVKALVG